MYFCLCFGGNRVCCFSPLLFKSLHSFERRIWACLGFRTDTKWQRTTSCAPVPKSRTLYVLLKMKVVVSHSHPTLCNSMDYSPPDSSVHGISQARILEWVAIPFSRDSTFFPTQGLNLGHLHCRQILFRLIHPRSPCCCWWVTQSYLTLWPHGLQHARLSCPSPTPKVCLNSCPLSRWCHPTISSSVIPFPSCLQSFPASGSFPMSQLFISGGQSTEASASASVPPMNIQDWFPLGLTYLISLQSKGLSRVFSNTTVQKHQFFGAQPLLWALGGRHLWKNAFEHKLPLHLGLLAIANWLTGIQFFHNNLLRF